MKLYRATGYCSECQQFDKVEGLSSPEDAEMFFQQGHMEKNGHWFEGSVEISSYDEKKEAKKRKGRRK